MKEKNPIDLYSEMIEQLEERKSILLDSLEKNEVEASLKSQTIIEGINGRINFFRRKIRMEMPAILMDAIDEDDDIMKLDDFRESVKSSFFTDYDGFGCYVRDGKKTNIKIYPSDFQYNSIRPDFDTIAWFNK
jgi:hypothetical protein